MKNRLWTNNHAKFNYFSKTVTSTFFIKWPSSHGMTLEQKEKKEDDAKKKGKKMEGKGFIILKKGVRRTSDLLREAENLILEQG
jgi:hypothetical protein